MDCLSGKQAQKVAWVLRLVQELDQVPRTYLKKMVGTNDLWEVRVEFAGDIFRLLGFLDGRRLILNHGFTKKGQKTPRNEIEVAERRKKDYFRR